MPLDYDMSNCSIGRTVGLLGEKWTFLIVREAWYGISRFSDFERALAAPRNLLADRLRMLVGEGILIRESYQEPGARTRDQYLLTAKGKEILPILIAFREWGDKYLADPAGPPMYLNHSGCGERVALELRCARGHLVEGSENVEPSPGPGLRFVPSPK